MAQLVEISYDSDNRNSYVRYSDTNHTAVYQRDDGMPIQEEDVDDLIAEKYTRFPVIDYQVTYVDDYTIQIDYTTAYLD